MVRIEGKVSGPKEVIRSMYLAPGLFFKALLSSLFSVREKFIGKKKGPRGFRLSLLSKRQKSNPGNYWSPQVAGLFKGYISSRANDISSLALRVGVGLNNPKNIHKALWLMQTTGKITGKHFLTIPMIKNLTEAGFMHSARGGTMQPDPLRKILMHNGSKEFITIRAGSKFLVVRRDAFLKSGRFKRNGLMYILQKSINMPKQFTGRYDFYKRWDEFGSNIQKIVGTNIDKAVLKVNKIYA